MNAAEALAVCETSVRRADPDRYFAGLFAPAARRPLLCGLYAFNHELVRASEAASEPVVSKMRLEWWREALDGAREGRPPAHPVAIGLVEIISRGSIAAADLHAFIAAREVESLSMPFATLAALESHANATSAALMRMAARLLRAEVKAEFLSDAGIAYGLAGTLRSVRFYGVRGRLLLPADLLAEESVTGFEVLSKKQTPALKRVIGRVRERALDHLARARQSTIPPSVLPAVLPAALVPAYLSRLANADDPLREDGEISQLRRQLILLRAAMSKHV